MTYTRIVFMQGEDANEALEILDEHGIEAAIDHLAQWDMGEGEGEGEESDEPSSGTDDNVHETDDGFRLTWNSRIGYIGLERINP